MTDVKEKSYNITALAFRIHKQIIYNGFWFSSERIAMQSLIDSTQYKVNGEVKVKIFKGKLVVTEI